MGSFFDIGCKAYNNNYGERGLTVGLNRTASNALETLFDEALQANHPDIHEKIMMYLPLDQISFSELSKEEFNLAVKAIKDCIHNRTEPTEGQSYQKRMWEEEIQPLILQDERYQQL
ncbi:hypothetical protein [Serratia sp. UGAL515B_01]|jgi:hypothetical protein|uniref:hypothetical protein n=1 Tax=Serratia sp. UGAL515B_01 TaxID=2986763 RepID=UPI0029545BF6|nr:hypothetical protein [Serratia sp. UGAL515B_01]WON76267.1 hypothetical protein OK023_13635 [Serratia sp. UGAL515B_01]